MIINRRVPIARLRPTIAINAHMRQKQKNRVRRVRISDTENIFLQGAFGFLLVLFSSLFRCCRV